jgi:hypothetical protein
VQLLNTDPRAYRSSARCSPGIRRGAAPTPARSAGAAAHRLQPGAQPRPHEGAHATS